MLGADGGVGLPDGPVAVAVIAYDEPGERPVMTQSMGTEHVTLMGLPPPMGSAVRVYGPVTPKDERVMSALREDPKTTTFIAGAFALGVTTEPAGEGGVGLPEEASVPVAETV